MAKNKAPDKKPDLLTEFHLKPGEVFIFGNFVQWAQEAGLSTIQADLLFQQMLKDGRILEVGEIDIIGGIKHFKAN